MLLGTRQKISSLQTDLDMNLEGMQIERESSFKCLVVKIDENLTWESRIIYISTKIAKVLGVLRRLKPYLPRDILITTFKSLIHFDYCKFQNSAARIITNSSYEKR